jgi:hypothetical protein
MVEQMEKAMRLDPVEPWWPQVYGAFLIRHTGLKKPKSS